MRGDRAHRDGSTPRPGRALGRRSRHSVAVVLAACLALGLGVGGAGVAVGDTDSTAPSPLQEAEEPPELASGERVNNTAVRLVFTDDGAVAATSISADDFLLSAGEIAGISTRNSESNAIVLITLREPVDTEELTVGIRDGSDIRDADGNTIDTSGFVGVRIDGMDSVEPSVRRLELPERASESAEIRVVFDEAVSSFHVTLSGPRGTVLTREAFERVRSTQYELSYEPPADGIYTVELVNATDQSGNSATFSRAASVAVRTTDVRAVAGVDLSGSSGLNLTFDAGRSDDRAVAHLWEFGDGDTATGERVSHAFTPGNYSVVLEVIDEFGNIGRDEMQLNLTANATAGFGTGDRASEQAAVSVDQGEWTGGAGAQISVIRATADEQVLVRADSAEDALVASETLSLEELLVTPARDGGFGVGLTLAGPESDLVRTAGDATAGDAVAGFLARPTVPDSALSSVTVRFSVDSDRLGDLGVTPDAVSLYREQGGSWTELKTTARGVSEQRVAFESELPGFSRFAVVAATDDDSATGGQEPDNGTMDPDSDSDSMPSDQVRVENVSLSETSIESGETVEIQAEIVNGGSEPGDYLAALGRNGSVLETQEVLRIPPDGESLPVLFTREINETGTVQFDINGTTAPELSVGESGGGGLFSFLGFLPLGLLRTFLLYIVAPVGALVVGLKGVAKVLGY